MSCEFTNLNTYSYYQFNTALNTSPVEVTGVFICNGYVVAGGNLYHPSKCPVHGDVKGWEPTGPKRPEVVGYINED